MGAGHGPPRLHFAARVYSRDDMAHGTTRTQSSAAAGEPPARVHAAGGASVAGQSWVCFAVQQLCQCATDSRSDWLELIERAGLSLIADEHARRS